MLGIDVDEVDRPSFTEILLSNYSSLPVFIDRNTSNMHYNGFSNRYLLKMPSKFYLRTSSTIWPLFHYLPADITIKEENWQGYKKANQIFAAYIAKIAQNGDIVWIHDYHLMLVPQMLREAMKISGKKIKIVFFLHIPFPTSEVYRYIFIRL